MKFLYTSNPNSDVPIMLVDKYIGKDAQGVVGIDGSQFAHEVLALKDAGKTKIEVWINSKGGNVSEGYSIYSALRNCGMNVTTVNMGLVDSTAGWVFQAGDKRVWSKHALGLIHEATNLAGEPVDSVNQSVAVMLAGKTTLAEDRIREMMKEERILNYAEAKAMGFCDDVRNSADQTDVYSGTDLTAVKNFGDTQIQKLIPKQRGMKINELLGLSNEASEQAMYAAVQTLLTDKQTAEGKVSALTTTLETTNAALTTTTDELARTTTELTEMKNAAKAADAKALVAEHVGKRIADTPEVVAQWEKMAMADHAGTKVLLESLNVNRQAPKPETKTEERKTGKVITTAAEYAVAAPVRK